MAFCPNCGAQVPDGTAYCTNCGAAIKTEQPQTYQVKTEVVTPNTTPILVFGILSLCLTAILGIIFGSIARNKAKVLALQGYPITGKAKVGQILGTIGLICGIISTIVIAIYALVAIIIAIGAAVQYGSY